MTSSDASSDRAIGLGPDAKEHVANVSFVLFATFGFHRAQPMYASLGTALDTAAGIVCGTVVRSNVGSVAEVWDLVEATIVLAIDELGGRESCDDAVDCIEGVEVDKPSFDRVSESDGRAASTKTPVMTAATITIVKVAGTILEPKTKKADF